MNSSPPSGSGPVESSRKRRPKTFQCRYCADTFNRLEHIQRHERTHTKEKPFSCACGKSFGRRDLLLRHGKLVHDRVARAPNSPTVAHTQSTVEGHSSSSGLNQSLAASQTDWESSNSNSLQSSNLRQFQNHGTHDSQVHHGSFLQSQINHYHNDSIPMESNIGGPEYILTGSADLPGDYNLFFDNFETSNFYLPTTVFDSELPISLWSRPHAVENEVGNHNNNNAANHNQDVASQNEYDALSRLGSRLPSLRLEEQNLIDSEPSPQADFFRVGPPWKISGPDHRRIQSKLSDFGAVLPEGFTLPSRHTLSRYFEGYISGFNQHLPFLHIPTFAVNNSVPELVLAIAAVGAQYRFESTKGNKLWYASKVVAFEQIRRRHSQNVADILLSPTPRKASLSQSPGSVSEPGNSNRPPPSDNFLLQTSELSRLLSPSSQARLATIQTLLILMAMGMWGPQALLREAMLIQNQLALLIRDHGLLTPELSGQALSWEEWIQFEGNCRTKSIAYCFFNLHSIAYNTPPLILTSEMKMNLPQSTEAWRAESAEEWLLVQRNGHQESLSFHHALSRLFNATQEDCSPISSLGNYALIHAIIQQIYVVRQASSMANPTTRGGSLPREDIEKFGEVLRLWQIGWERAPESSLDPTNPYGPVAFSSTALLRLAYIRLHCDLGPCRGLDTRDSQIIARSLQASPSLLRSPLLSRAILQAAHALSIPVKIGIKFVANTHTLSWSMQHSLANLESGFLLSKWLLMIADYINDLTVDERNLLEMVQSIVGETHLAIPYDHSHGLPGTAEVKQLSVAVVRLWAEVFSGNHHVFPLVGVIGAALETYADLQEGGG